MAGTGYRKAAEAFQTAFGITVDHSSESTASIWVPKMEKKREAGIYSYDAVVVPPNSALIRLKPKGAWDPIRPLIFRPDVLDDKMWREGFEKQFIDLDKQYAFGYSFDVAHTVAIDNTTVRPDEIRGMRDLTDPKWKGRIMISDVRHGSIWIAMRSVRATAPGADDLIKKLFIDQEPTYIREDRAKAEAVVRKRSAIGIGILLPPLQEFRDAGVANHVEFLDRPEIDYATTYAVLVYNKAPHPNAAKLFINWFLSKEGQIAFCKELPMNSARTDVPPFNKDGIATPGAKYYFAKHESEYAKQTETLNFLTALLGLSN
ncbi:MAG: ABC transporter substrate-binding protein [Dehalococcoidia bacterium]|nr:ABC transporter substrate-binding protein [Dehalococcoidia bacterium]